MRYIISGTNIEITNALQQKVMDKLSKLEKFSWQKLAQVTLSVEKLRHIIEVTIPFQGTILRAEVDERIYAAIDEVVDVLERQLLKHKAGLKTNIETIVLLRRNLLSILKIMRMMMQQ